MDGPDLRPVPAAAVTLLSRLIAAALLQDASASRAARRKALEAHEALLRLSPDRAELESHLDGLWARAIAAAETPGLLGAGLSASPSLPAACPVAARDLLASGLAVEPIEQAIRAGTATG